MVRDTQINLCAQAYCLLETALVVRRGGISTPSTPTSKKSGAASPKPDVRAIAAANNALLEPARVVLRRIATQLASRADAMKPSAAVARVADLSTFPLVRLRYLTLGNEH